VSTISHWRTEWTCCGERACLRVLEGGCSVPVGISSSLTGELSDKKILQMTCTVTALDGGFQVEQTVEGAVNSREDAEGLGKRLASLLIDHGAGRVLDDVKRDREAKQAKTQATSQ
jgi:hydroxymethylbilane synthase